MLKEKEKPNKTGSTNDVKQRVQLDLSEKMCELIDQLANDTGASSRAEVIRRAISLYGILCDEKNSGKRIELIDPKDSSIRERLLLP